MQPDSRGAGGRPAVIALVGPTASGKSELGCDLAVGLGGEVINCDSMQTYRGMDIGTGKLPAALRRGVAHHMLDVWDISKSASVAEYQRLARATALDMERRERLPIFVGGSGLYLRAAIDDLRFPASDPEVRAQLEKELSRVGSVELHGQLRAVAPNAAAAILPTNGRRIVRALEAIELTGRFEPNLPIDNSYLPCLQIGIDLPRAELDERIARRVDAMFAGGLVDEVRRLRALGLDSSPTARYALGYPQVTRMLDGELTEAAVREMTSAATRRFARRQLAWLHRDPRIEWFDGTDASLLRDRVLDRVEEWQRQPTQVRA